MKATLIGATGLIGGHILEYLIEDEAFDLVTLIVRRPMNISHEKIKINVIDFKDSNAFKAAVEPDSIIFCAIGTTQKKVAGDKEKYYQIDYDIPVNAAKYGLEKNCKFFSLVSAIGANAKSSNFYTKLKGKVEEKIESFNYSSFDVFRPSVLLGDRKEQRSTEKTAQVLMTTFSFLVPSKYKAIEAKDVAKAMVLSSKQLHQGKRVFTYKQIQEVIKA